MFPTNLREEELKNKVAQTYFPDLDCTTIIGNIDFCVKPPVEHSDPTLLLEQPAFLWAEAKRGKSDVVKSIVQLILTIGKAKTFNQYLPPTLLAAFDAEKIAFILYNDVHEVFYQNGFNWNITPSNPNTPEFKQVYEHVKTTIMNAALLFFWGKDDRDLKQFITQNFVLNKTALGKIQIDKNNFMIIYTKWLEAVKPTIVVNWTIAKQNGIIDGDFYLADLLSRHNQTLKQKLWVLLKYDHYELDRKIDSLGMFISRKTAFKDKQAAHTLFWNKYERPPQEDYWDYIVRRRDLLVPQDVRERKGSFFTPKLWVELSQKYITTVLGEDWQDDYFIWDCAAGTGNLLAGLTNKYNIYASTVDKQDVDVMHDRIKNGANLLEDHVFQFDFLNDDFDKLPKGLKTIIDDPVQRKKLVIYINPPYAEAPQRRFGKETKRAVEQTLINKRYSKRLGQGRRELFVQFLTRIYFEIEGCTIASFSTLKILSGQHFIDFRNFFLAKLKTCFVVPANTFDNVKGKFPIGFTVWNTAEREQFNKLTADVYNKNGEYTGRKKYFAYQNGEYINDWIKPFRAHKTAENIIGKFPFMGNDFQVQNIIQINHVKMVYNKAAGQFLINADNLIKACIYFAVRKCIKATWLNDRDQFLAPNPKWQKDTEFQNDCLTYTLFNNNIQSPYGTNHWIPFTEAEVQARSRFESHFMTDFIKGKVKIKPTNGLHDSPQRANRHLIFSEAAKAVFEAAKVVWLYYHTQPNVDVNASLYDIKAHFQGRNSTGRMNSKSADEHYNKLIGELRTQLNGLAFKIQPKVYKYGFLLS